MVAAAAALSLIELVVCVLGIEFSGKADSIDLGRSDILVADGGTMVSSSVPYASRPISPFKAAPYLTWKRQGYSELGGFFKAPWLTPVLLPSAV